MIDNIEFLFLSIILFWICMSAIALLYFIFSELTLLAGYISFAVL